MVCLGSEPGTPRWEEQTDPLSCGDPVEPLQVHQQSSAFYLEFNQKHICH